MTQLPTPEPGRHAAESFVSSYLAHLVCDEVSGSSAFRGGQDAADVALAAYDVTGYASKRNEVWPDSRRGASQLSPYIRHGLLPLRSVWDHVAGGPSRDVRKFRDELLWQEFSRHWYARLGGRTRVGIRRELDGATDPDDADDVWDRSMACLDLVVGELEEGGWLVNQTRMWMSSHWSVREGWRWQSGDDWFFRHLLDGSRAANRLGWQWTTGVGSTKSYSFTRWQVNKRAPGLCDTCEHRHACPIEDWPDDPALRSRERVGAVRSDADVETTAGPPNVVGRHPPESVWLTAESLGDLDPALSAHPDLPAIFVFDEALLTELRLSSKRLVFLTETLAELATRREVELHLGDPIEILGGRAAAVTFAPVPGFRRRAGAIEPAEVHPWPWLTRPGGGSVSSFSAWRKAVAAVPTHVAANTTSSRSSDQPTLW